MRCSILVSAVILTACIIPVAASAKTTTSSAGTLASCTPKVQPTGKWGSWVATKPASSMLVSHRPAIKYPKNSGHVAVGGFCHVNKPGLGKRFVETRRKLAPKHTTPVAPPTIVVGNPLPVTPVAPPVVTPPAPPVVVTPPANPTPPAPVKPSTCDNVAVTQPGGNGIAQFTVQYTLFNGDVLDHVTVRPGTNVPGSSNQLAFDVEPVNGVASGSYQYNTDQPDFQLSVTATFKRLDGTMVTTDIDQDAGPGHCTQFVHVPLAVLVCGAAGVPEPISGLNAVSLDATIGAHYTLLNRARFLSAEFAWGDGSSNTTQASSNNEADFAHPYAGPGDYPLVVTFHYSVPGSQQQRTTVCSGTVHVPAPVV